VNVAEGQQARGNMLGQNERVPLARALIFALSSLPITAVALPLGVYLPRYFTSHIGLGLAAVGATLGAIRLIDIGLDPFLGVVMDRTRTPLGRYRPWLILGAPILMLAVYMLFFAPVGISSAYLLIWMLVLYAGLSTLTLSQAAWAAALATNYADRSRVYGLIAAVGVIGTVLILGLPIVLGAGQAPSQERDVHIMGWFMLAVTPAAIAIVALAAPERIAPKPLSEKFRVRDYWELIKRPEMVRIIFCDFVVAFGPGTTAALYLFFFEDARGYTPAQTNLLLLIYIAAALFGSPFWGWLGARLQKHRTLIISSVVYSICQTIIILVPHATMSLMVPAMLAVGMASAGFVQLVRAMVADVADEVRLEQGRERSSLLYAMVTTTQKVASALTLSVTYFVLSLVNYNPAEGAVNTPEAIHGLELCYIAAPIVFALVGASAFIGYKLDAKRHAEIRAALDARDAAAAVEAATQSPTI
jgi:Na+/melibiose symporter-like transporter